MPSPSPSSSSSSSASSTTLERSSSLHTLSDDTSSPLSPGSSRSSVLECHPDPKHDSDVFIITTSTIDDENEDEDDTGAVVTTVEACRQQATEHLTVAKRLLSSAKSYERSSSGSKADALRAVRSFGDSLVSLLRLRTLSPPPPPPPKSDTTTYLQQPVVVAHVSKLLLSNNLESRLASSSKSKDAIDAHAHSFGDTFVSRLTNK
jgi:hypothetical protein